jgi:tetraacyldisaccharide 4'-kinase
VDALAGGDEPLQIALACPGARVVSAGRRSDAARVAVALGAQVLVMDDGFQHRYLRRTLDIVVLDGRRDPFEDRLLPAGMLRERIGGLRRAHMVAISRSESAAVDWRGKLDSVFRGPVIAFVTRGAGLGRLPLSRGDGSVGAQAPGPAEPAGPLLAFSGIGDHSVFLAELRRTGVEVTADMRFRDHHWYGGADAGALAGALRRSGASGFVTTSKDAVRLRAVPSVAAALAAAGPVFVLDVAAAITAGGRELDAALEEQVKRRAPQGSVR